MIATVVVVAAFNNATQLSNAYGFAVATVMFTTTVLISLQIRYVKHLPYIFGILFLLFFGFLDGKVITPFDADAEMFQVSSGALR